MKKDNIEEIYSDLKSFSKEPPKELWDNIEARLHPKKKRRVIFWLFGSAAAILVLLFGFLLFKPASGIENMPINESVNKVSDVEKNQPKNDAPKNELDSTNSNNAVAETKTSNDSTENREMNTNKALQNVVNKRSLANSDSSNAVDESSNSKKHKNKLTNEHLSNGSEVVSTKDNDFKNKTKKEVIGNSNLIPDLKQKNKSLIDDTKEAVIASVDSLTQDKTDTKLDLYKELVAENSVEKDSVKTDVIERSKWSVEVLGGLSSTASDASFQGTTVNTSAQNDFVYTFKVGYAITDKIVVKTGLGKNSLGQQVDNIAYATQEGSLSSGGGQSIVADESVVFFASPELINDSTSYNDFGENGTLQQQLDYFQVPLEVSCKLLTKEKYDILLGVGVNVNFISNNMAYLNGEEIGESKDVNNTVFGATLNTNFSYNLTKKTILFVEPSYNYFQKPIDNNAQNFKNTQFRILFGVQLKL
ncbi:hypothetical protein [Winogradskyella marincola]|uniref:Outer membrane protein beta-barrel domain-containing protein n=1 Tax=Winogradskyella marincola TaxID=3037795 RepID=A0ABT6G029_9FLAO|nr:hypothetical protein [Winogradskyella sp. YYF002]MDG4715403.1 hypothetical protein [Winogradskyella sp. YYF002]